MIALKGIESLLIFVVGSKEMEEGAYVYPIVCSVWWNPGNRKQFPLCLYLAEVNIATFFFINDLSNPNGPKYWKYRIYW